MLAVQYISDFNSSGKTQFLNFCDNEAAINKITFQALSTPSTRAGCPWTLRVDDA